jgi:hypothetical protein
MTSSYSWRTGSDPGAGSVRGGCGHGCTGAWWDSFGGRQVQVMADGAVLAPV